MAGLRRRGGGPTWISRKAVSRQPSGQLGLNAAQHDQPSGVRLDKDGVRDRATQLDVIVEQITHRDCQSWDLNDEPALFAQVMADKDAARWERSELLILGGGQEV
ncbi:MAG TPA: hypothetical protein PLW65_03410 [Pseudomonadota bacterium]|nr:hypothetical protein [Pseudomonadota bacterium]